VIILTPGNDAAEPAAGIWIEEALHGYGYGRQAIATIVAFAANDLEASSGVSCR
jgi:RimJ/RimL family protein N-acetyltransferase